MPRVRYLDSSRYAIRGGPVFENEDDEAEVGEDTAERLTARDDFERVETDDEPASEPTTEPADVAAFDADEWLEQDYQTRAERVEAGEVDDHFGKILQVETSETVKDAVDARREA